MKPFDGYDKITCIFFLAYRVRFPVQLDNHLKISTYINADFFIEIAISIIFTEVKCSIYFI